MNHEENSNSGEETTNPFSDLSINYEDELFDVENILSGILQSSVVLKDYTSDLEKFNIHRPLTRSERKIVCNTLMDFAVKNKILLRRSDFPKITEKIQFIFKKEPTSLYYRPPNKIEKRCKKSLKTDEILNVENKAKKPRSIGPSGQLYTSYRYRISKKRDDLKKHKQSTDSYYR